MEDTALKAAIRKLLDHGEAAQDAKMMKMAAAKKGPVAAPEMCDDCEVAMVDGKCPKCGKESAPAGEDESELAGLLEQGAEG